jgi:6-phosphofructokinase 1
VKYSGAADAIVGMLEKSLSPDLFLETRRFESDSSPLFSRKVGHTQRGGRPISFDRFAATQLGGKAVELLAAGYSNEIATLQYSTNEGFTFRSIAANRLRDRWGEIHPREVHPSLYDAGRMQLSYSWHGISQTNLHSRRRG